MYTHYRWHSFKNCADFWTFQQFKSTFFLFHGDYGREKELFDNNNVMCGRSKERIGQLSIFR